MRQVKAIPITHENFAPFGQFYTMADPKGYALCGEIHKFFPDRLTASANHNVGYSPILVKKPERMIISAVEYHTTTWEMIMPPHRQERPFPTWRRRLSFRRILLSR